jgi:integrase
MLMLTLARRDEVCGMAWGELAADLSTWTQPAGRTKNGRAHVVHLTEPARGLLQERLGTEPGKRLPTLPAADTLAFGTMTAERLRPISGHSWVKRELDKAIAKARAKIAAEAGRDADAMPGWVLHDFRRAGVTWLAGAGFAPHIADKLLNHTAGTISGVMATYQRSEFLAEREAALDAWGAHVLAMGEGVAAAGNVVAMRPARASRATV